MFIECVKDDGTQIFVNLDLIKTVVLHHTKQGFVTMFPTTGARFVCRIVTICELKRLVTGEINIDSKPPKFPIPRN